MMKPGDFPIGSPESRAAARMLAANRPDTRRRIEIVTNVCFLQDDEGRRPEGWNDKKHYVEPWRHCGDVLMRIVYVPSGMSADEARDIFSN